jgi:hypothetical protein
MDPTGNAARSYWAHPNANALPHSRTDPCDNDTSSHCRSQHCPTPTSESDFLQYSSRNELTPTAHDAASLHEMRWEPGKRGGQRGSSRWGLRPNSRSKHDNSRHGTLAILAALNAPPFPVKPVNPTQDLNAVGRTGTPPLGGIRIDEPGATWSADQEREHHAKAVVACTKRASKWSSRAVLSPEAPRPANAQGFGASQHLKASPAGSGSAKAQRATQPDSKQSLPSGNAPLLESGQSSVLPKNVLPPAADGRGNTGNGFDILLGDRIAATDTNNSNEAQQAQSRTQPFRAPRGGGGARPITHAATYTPGVTRLQGKTPQHHNRAATVATTSYSTLDSGIGSKSTAQVGEVTKEVSIRNAIEDLNSIVKRSDPEKQGSGSSEEGAEVDVLPLMHEGHAWKARHARQHSKPRAAGAGQQRRCDTCVRIDLFACTSYQGSHCSSTVFHGVSGFGHSFSLMHEKKVHKKAISSMQVMQHVDSGWQSQSVHVDPPHSVKDLFVGRISLA